MAKKMAKKPAKAARKVASTKKAAAKKPAAARVSASQHKFMLGEERIPKRWYNIMADLPVPLPPPLHPGTLKPIGPDDLSPIFPMGLIMQEVSGEREIGIPEPVRDIYRMWRPTPLYRAHALEKALGTTAKIFLQV